MPLADFRYKPRSLAPYRLPIAAKHDIRASMITRQITCLSSLKNCWNSIGRGACMRSRIGSSINMRSQVTYHYDHLACNGLDSMASFTASVDINCLLNLISISRTKFRVYFNRLYLCYNLAFYGYFGSYILGCYVDKSHPRIFPRPPSLPNTDSFAFQSHI